MNFKASTLVWNGLNRLKIDRLLEPLTRPPGWTILWGHGVHAGSNGWHRSDPRHIPVQIFARQMELLLAQGYQFITLSEGLRCLAQGEPMDRKVTLSFDDGFRNVVQWAYPLMQKWNLKGCLFVVAGLVDQKQLLWTDQIEVVCRWHKGREFELQLPEGPLRFRLHSEPAVDSAIKAIKRHFRALPGDRHRYYFQQVEALFAQVKPGFVPDDFRLAGRSDLQGLDPGVLEIGNHTMSHPQLTQLGAEALHWEIHEAKIKLESWLQRPVPHFCYPSGNYNAEVLAEVQRVGHVSALTTAYGVNAPGISAFELRRMLLPPDLASFQCRLSGLEGRMHRLKARFTRSSPSAPRRIRRLVVFSHKPTWVSPLSPSGFATDGGFPFQMRSISELFDSTVLLVPCLPKNPGPSESPLFGPNLSIVPLTYPAGLRLRRKLTFPFWMLRNLPLMLREFWRADAVHAPIPGDIGTVGIVLALVAGKPLFVRHCGNWLCPKTTAEHLWKWSMERFAGGRNLMLATGGGDASPSGRNPHVRWIFSTSLRRDQIAAFGHPRQHPKGRPFRLVIASRQDRKKGTGLAVEALPLIRQQFPGTRLEVLGDGPDLPVFREMAARLGLEGAVNFHGYVNHLQLLQTMQEADLFCFPTSASEGFPKVVLEAMACGLPVVTTAVSVLPQLIGDQCGVILKSPTPQSVAEAVCAVLGSAQKYETMSQCAVATARQFSLEAWRDTIGQHLATAWGPLRETRETEISGQRSAARNPLSAFISAFQPDL